ncbi:hypothetical protein CQW23_31311 [Capsicum baccatum]|uniref:Uncharacterized protein n=1 Tax=Capsicum baccatum TaxID=33114 RepID=A0A2G2V7Y9_CAPBA|nr:hypothetical protein CQW23_31311 [Capsicum baccatum]
MVPRHLGATVPWCQGARPPWCHGAMVPWCPGAMVARRLGATVPWCHGATPPWCHGAMAPRCLGALLSWCPGAKVPRRLGAMMPCRLGATVAWCHGSMAPRCEAALVPWCHGAGCKERRTGQIGVDEGPMPTDLPHPSIPTAAYGPRHRTTKRGRRWTQGRPIDLPRARNARGERRSIKLDNESSTGNRPRASLHCASPATEMADGGSRGDEGTPRLMHGRRPRRPPALAANWAQPKACSAWSLPRKQNPVLAACTKAPPRPKSSSRSPVVNDATDTRHEPHVPYWWVNNPTLGEFCFTMIGRADIEGSKSNVAMNVWLPQASYLYGNFFDTSTFEFQRSKGSLGHAFTVCSHSNPSQKIKVGRRCTPRGDPWEDPTNQLRCALRVYSPVDSHTCQTPLSVFEDGSNGEPTGQRSERADAEARQRHVLPATIEETVFHKRIESPGFGRPLNPRWSTPRVDRRTGSSPLYILLEAHRRPPSASLPIISSTL